MVGIGHSGVQAQEFLCAFPPLESLLLSFLTSGRSVRLLNDVVAACRGDHLLVIDIDQTWDFPEGCPIPAELIGMTDLWDVVFAQQPGQEDRCRCCVAMPLKEDVEHKTVLVHSPPKPVSNAIDARTHLVERPPGTPPGFPVARAFNEESAELDAPLA